MVKKPQDYKKRVTKKDRQKALLGHYENTLKNNFIKNMSLGFHTCNKLILEKINNGASLEEIRQFCELNEKNEDTITDIMANNNEEVGEL